MLTIHGNPFSIPSNKVTYFCHLLDLDFEFAVKDFASGEMKSTEYLALHPAGKVPAMDDDGFVLFESEAICRYLGAKHNSPALPTDLKARAIVDQWNAFAMQHIGLAMGKVLFNRIVAPKFGLEVDERSMREGGEWLSRYLPIIDQRLGESPYLGGDQITLADISLLVNAERGAEMDLSLDPYPNLARWLQDVQSQAFYARTKTA